MCDSQRSAMRVRAYGFGCLQDTPSLVAQTRQPFVGPDHSPGTGVIEFARSPFTR